MYKYKIAIYDESGTQHLVPGEASFSEITPAIKKALSEKTRMLANHGELYDACDRLNLNPEKRGVSLELQKFINEGVHPFGYYISPLVEEDYIGVDPDLFKAFSDEFETTDWAMCKTEFFS
jgi:hypothetical protein